MTLCWSLDKVGPICRSVEDCALVLEALNGGDPADRSSIDMPFSHDPGADFAGLRVGWWPPAFSAAGATQVERNALDTLRGLGVETVEIDLPDLPWSALRAILTAEAAAAFEPMTLSDEDDRLSWQDPVAWPNTFRAARFLSAVDHIQADRLRYRVMQEIDNVFQSVDLVIGPFGTGPMLLATNFTGHPCLHLRAGFLDLPSRIAPPATAIPQPPAQPYAQPQTHRVPQGISLWAGLFREARLIALGRALEAALNVAAERPAPVAD